MDSSTSTKCSAAESVRVQIEKAHNFMRQYRDPESRELKKLSANQFMDVWSHYDKDGKFLCFYVLSYVLPLPVPFPYVYGYFVQIVIRCCYYILSQ